MRRGRRAGRALAGAVALAAALLAGPARGAPPGGGGPGPGVGSDRAAAPPAVDYDPAGHAWNGLAGFVALAEGMGFAVDAVGALEWGDLGRGDVLVLVYPLQQVDPERLRAFVQAGGNALLADDFGEGHDALAGLGLLRAETGNVRADRYQDGRAWAPIATARGAHPLAAGVGDLVTNHPAALTHVEGATPIFGFAEGELVVAGERGAGRFVALADPSVLINRMLRYRGNLAFATNALRWLDRGGPRRRVVLLRGDVPMYGEPRRVIAHASTGAVGEAIDELNGWLDSSKGWLLTEPAMRAVAGLLVLGLLALVLGAVPARRGASIDGGWLRLAPPARRDEPHGLVAASDAGAANHLVLACVLRDHVQALLGPRLGLREPLFSTDEEALVGRVGAAVGPEAAAALARVYRRLRALPPRAQAAARWAASDLRARDFDQLHDDVAALCRTLGHDLTGALAGGEAPPRTEGRGG